MTEKTTRVVGDVVRMLSGGPLMSVIGVDGEKSVVVAWFDGEQHIQTASLPTLALGVAEVTGMFVSRRDAIRQALQEAAR